MVAKFVEFSPVYLSKVSEEEAELHSVSFSLINHGKSISIKLKHLNTLCPTKPLSSRRVLFETIDWMFWVWTFIFASWPTIKHTSGMFSVVKQVHVIHQFSSGLLFPLGLKVRATLLIQNRWPVGSGPSSNTWPRWASQFLQRTSVPALPRLLSGRRMMEVWLSSCSHVPWASLKAGQPVPESYLASELKSGASQQTQWYIPTSECLR